VCISWPGCLAEDVSSPVRVSDAGLALDAAAEGLGRATVPELLARADIASGRLAVIGEPRDSRLGYWLVAPLPQWRQKKVKALVEKLGE
jgi:LysR family glycine cleavage system transcriptional activator